MIMYGMGSASIATSLGVDLNEAQSIIDGFYNGFPKVRTWIDTTNKFAKEHLYVEDFWGRRRRLPDLGLKRYTVKYSDKSLDQSDVLFNPLLNSIVRRNTNASLIDKYTKMVYESRTRNQVSKIKQDAQRDGITITDNGGFIAQAERQCVNARVQGGAATMSKIAMIKVSNSEELKNLGFKLLIAVHDELIGECPEENKDKVAEKLSEIMREAAKPTVCVPFKCDAEIEKMWYLNEYTDNIKKEYKSLKESGVEDAFRSVCEEHTEMEPQKIKLLLE